MPTNLPLDMSKLEGKLGEDPQNHIMSFHLWCSLNNIVDDFVRLRFIDWYVIRAYKRDNERSENKDGKFKNWTILFVL